MTRLRLLIISSLAGAIFLFPSCIALISHVQCPHSVFADEIMMVAVDGSVVGLGGGMVGVVVQVPDSFEFRGALYVTKYARRPLRRSKAIARLFTPEPGYKVIALADSIPGSRETEADVRVLLRFIPHEAGAFEVKASAGVLEEEGGKPVWRPTDPVDSFDFSQIIDARYSSPVQVAFPDRNGTAALSLSGKREYVVLPDSGLFTMSLRQDFSVELWCNTISTDAAILSTRQDDFQTAFPFELSTNERGEAVVSASAGDSVCVSEGAVCIADGAWHHCAVSWFADSLRFELIVDGALAGSLNLPRLVSAGNVELVLGARPNRTHFLRGTIDELRFWETARSIKEVSYYRDLALSGYEQNLFALYSFESGTEGRLPNSASGRVLEAIAYNRPRLVPSTAPLRIELLAFSATLDENSVLMSWETFDESKVEAYEVEKRTEEGRYAVFERIPPMRNLENHQAYELTDSWGGKTITYYRLRKINLDGSILYSEDIPIGAEQILDFVLGSSDPNPFTDSTRISYRLDRRTAVMLAVYDIRGREVQMLVSERQPAGEYHVVFDAKDLAGGMYFYKMWTQAGSQTKKMYLAR